MDILINNAGLLSINQSLREGSPEDIQRIVDVNLMSHFWISFLAFFNVHLTINKLLSHTLWALLNGMVYNLMCGRILHSEKGEPVSWMLCGMPGCIVSARSRLCKNYNCVSLNLNQLNHANGKILRMDRNIVANDIFNGVLLYRRKIYITKSSPCDFKASFGTSVTCRIASSPTWKWLKRPKII